MLHLGKSYAALLLAIALSSPLSFGQEGAPAYSYDRLMSTAGVNCSSVTAMTRDSQGRLWLGLPTGAAYFSNGSLTPVNTISVGGREVRTGSVTRIACAERVLLATDSFLADYDPDTGAAVIINNPEGKDIRTECLLSRGDDAVFFEYSSGRLYQYSFDLRTLRILYTFPEGEAFRFKNILNPGSDRLILADDDKGLFLLDLKALTHQSICSDSGPSMSARSAFIDAGGILWAFWSKCGITGADVADSFKTVVNIPLQDAPFSASDVTSLAEIPDGRLSLTTAGYGVYLLDTLTGDCEHPDNPALDHTLGTFVNRANSDLIFTTLNDGIITRRTGVMHLLTGSGNNHQQSVGTTCACQLDERRICFGTATRGLLIYDETTSEMSSVPLTEGMGVSSLCRYDSDHLLVNFTGEGAFILDIRTLEMVRSERFSSPGQLTVASSDGQILSFNGRRAHFALDPSTGETLSILTSDLNDDLSVIKSAVPYAGGVVLSSDKAVYRLDCSTLSLEHVYSCPKDDRSAVTSISADPAGKVWMAVGDVLYACDPAGKAASEVLDLSDIGSVLSIACDGSSTLWVTLLGDILIKFDTTSLAGEYYFRPDGLGYSDFSGLYSFISSTGSLYLPKAGATLRVDPAQPVPACKSTAYAECASLRQGSSFRRLDARSGKIPSISLSSARGEVEVDFALHTANPIEPVYVRYRLMRGSSPVYTVTTADPSLRLPVMKTGIYTLHSRVLGRSGLGEDRVMLRMTVAGPALGGVWAYLLLAALLLCLALLLLKKFSSGRQSSAAPSGAEIIKQLNIPVPRYNDIELETINLSLLVVDPDIEVCTLVKDKLSSKFRYVYTAQGGGSALKLAVDRKPDVVLTEIVMPQMNGFELCRAIKDEPSLTSTVVVFLTDLTGIESQTVACRMGADAFVPKPFHAETLYGIIKAVLKNHRDIRIRYSSSSLMTGALSNKLSYTSSDEQFVLKLNDFIKENISNPDLGVDMLVEHMCVSRTTLFNKMNSLLGTSAVKYIRRMRIEVAKELLAGTDKSIGEIAVETGFTESQYFSTVFKQETGVAPSTYRK